MYWVTDVHQPPVYLRSIAVKKWIYTYMAILERFILGTDGLILSSVFLRNKENVTIHESTQSFVSSRIFLYFLIKHVRWSKLNRIRKYNTILLRLISWNVRVISCFFLFMRSIISWELGKSHIVLLYFVNFKYNTFLIQYICRIQNERHIWTK